MSMEDEVSTLKLKVQLYCGEEIAIGPGKAELLGEIARTGSISAAARAMEMSYRRAWMLVDTMNRCFREPLVETHPGGGADKGAKLTEAGVQVIALYEGLLRQAEAGAEGEKLEALLRSIRTQPETPRSR